MNLSPARNCVIGLWPDTTVDFDQGLNKAASKVREALGDSAENPRFVETVARRGYRFLADVTVVADAAADRTSAEPTSDPNPPKTDAGILIPEASKATYGRTFAGAALALFLIVCLAVVWTLVAHTSASPAIGSLAVLPLENLSGDASQDYFADGMTEELINRLGQISALRVISRTSAMAYKDAP